MNTIDYYNAHAQQFSDTTLHLAFTEVQDRFLKYLPEQSHILDFGCGAGRDTLYFLSKGYNVTATDGSKEIVKLAQRNARIPVRELLFTQLDETNTYDGIWACSSILHCNGSDLKDVFARMQRALRDNGILYVSFKYGTFEGERNGRFFHDMTEETFDMFLKDFPGFTVLEQWISHDIRPGRENEKWLNVIMKKAD